MIERLLLLVLAVQVVQVVLAVLVHQLSREILRRIWEEK